MTVAYYRAPAEAKDLHVWDRINGGDIAAITTQDAEPVDDVVVTLRGQLQSKLFISARHRTGAVALTAKSKAFIICRFSPLRDNSFSLQLHYNKRVA